MVETLIAKVGRKTFQGIANRLERAAGRRTKAALVHRRHQNDQRQRGAHMTLSAHLLPSGL
ncbi:hypothetical protein GXB81_23395 [Paraburkholderia sp. Ac-20336]|uniref:hypothetical protein n=1 Tax=Burkholderia sp. Ax-1724 TaxID=2608336 RepID=UPI001420EB63|nr:hypothetical protein [Burkholderia sp. Ax-1724]MBN3805975.1 hypothetical protein [Paraburkholderia sp. Ac-20336]